MKYNAIGWSTTKVGSGYYKGRIYGVRYQNPTVDLQTMTGKNRAELVRRLKKMVVVLRRANASAPSSPRKSSVKASVIQDQMVGLENERDAGYERMFGKSNPKRKTYAQKRKDAAAKWKAEKAILPKWANKEYTHYVVLEDGTIESGWHFAEDARDMKKEWAETGTISKVVAKSTLIKMVLNGEAHAGSRPNPQKTKANQMQNSNNDPRKGKVRAMPAPPYIYHSGYEGNLWVVGGTAYGYLYNTSGDIRTWKTRSGAQKAARAYAKIWGDTHIKSNPPKRTRWRNRTKKNPSETTGNRKCTICGKPIILSPSASERARKFGETPKYYLDLFTQHSDCLIKKRDEDVRKLMRSKKNPRTAINKAATIPKGKRAGETFTKGGRKFTVVSYLRNGKRVRFARKA